MLLKDEGNSAPLKSAAVLPECFIQRDKQTETTDDGSQAMRRGGGTCPP